MKIKIFETINSDIRNSILQLWRQHAFVHLEKIYSTYLTKTQSFHLCLPNLALFSKFLKIYTFHRKTLSRQWHQNFPTSEMAFPWSWSVTNSKRKSFVWSFGGLAGGSRDVLIEYQRWSHCSNQGHLLFIRNGEKMLRNGVVPYVFVSGLLFSGKK